MTQHMGQSFQRNHQYDPDTGEIKVTIRGRADKPEPKNKDGTALVNQFRHDGFEVCPDCIYDSEEKKVYQPLKDIKGQPILIGGRFQKDFDQPVITIK